MYSGGLCAKAYILQGDECSFPELHQEDRKIIIAVCEKGITWYAFHEIFYVPVGKYSGLFKRM